MGTSATEGGLGRRAAAAFIRSFLVSTSGRAVAVLSTFVLARLLTPLDYGIASLGLLVVLVLQPLTDIGIAQALVRASEDQMATRARTAFWLVVLLGLALYALVFVTADLVAALYRQPELAPMLRLICLSVPLYSLSRIPSALLERNLQFGRKGIPEMLSSLAYGVVAIWLAYLGYGFWSIAVASVLRSAIQTAGVIAISRWRPGFIFDREVARELINYARYLMAGSMLRLAYTNVDNALVGNVVGMTALGYYAMAYNLGNLVANQISDPLGRVAFPAYSRMLPDIKRTLSSALLMLRYTGLVITPITVMGIVAVPFLVPLVLGEKWSPLIFSLQVMLIYGWERTLAPIHWALMLAADMGRESMRINLVSLVLALFAALPAARLYGFNGVAVVFTVLELVRLFLMVQVDRARLGLGWLQQISELWPSLAASLAAGGLLAVLQLVFPPTKVPLAAAELLVAGFSYLAFLLVTGRLNRAQLAGLREMASSRRA
jgi:O-antigen/teichoic acid export membrane protein